MIKVAVEQEIEWSKHITWCRIVWMSEENIENYTKWLADWRLNMLGLSSLYGVNKNPYKHLDIIQDQNSEKWNFFETTVTNYSQSSWMKWSWEF
jgi:ribonucleoside-diphosphate reductase beta chain